MKLYIGNLDEKIQSSHLKEAFQEFGKVKSAIVINDKKTGESKGFGFIEMPDEAEAQNTVKSRRPRAPSSRG
jgi:RNA recognition motif-containing protein